MKKSDRKKGLDKEKMPLKFRICKKIKKGIDFIEKSRYN